MVEARNQLVLLGDSHLARVNRPRLRRLQSLLGAGWIVHNHAFGGADSRDVLARAPFEARAADARFVVGVGTNDLAPWKQVPQEEFTANLAWVVGALPAGRVVLLTPPPVADAGGARSGRRRSGSLVRAYSAAVMEVAGPDVPVVDCSTVFRGAEVLADDGVHLSRRGYDLLLPAIALAVRPTRDPGVGHDAARRVAALGGAEPGAAAAPRR